MACSAQLVFRTVAIIMCFCSSAAQQRPQAHCSLELQGRSPTSDGVATAALNCTGDAPITVGINSTYMLPPILRFSGVTVVTDLACMSRAATATATAAGLDKGVFALLYFCGDYHLNLTYLVVERVWQVVDAPTWHAGMVAFGDGVSVSISDGRMLYNQGCSLLLFLDQAVASITDTLVAWNSGRVGVGLWAGNNASVTIRNCSFRENNSTAGAAIALSHNTAVAIESSACSFNTAMDSGGALLAEDSSSIRITTCSFSNNVAGYNGGALAAKGSAQVIFLGPDAASTSLPPWPQHAAQQPKLAPSSFIQNNSAAYGGGIALLDQAVLSMTPGSLVVEHNTASRRGGGVRVGSSNFDVGDLLASVHNNTAVYDGDISLDAVPNLTIVGNTSVHGFVSRPGDSNAMLAVRLFVSGFYGLPCEGVLVQATMLNGTRMLGLNRSDSIGIAYMSLSVRQPPGLYNVTFELPGNDFEPSSAQPVNLSLQVRSCVQGEVAPTPDTCQVCLQGFYSLDPSRAVCEPCVQGAVCSGGNAITPLPGMWHSSADSMQMHRCPNQLACEGSRQTLLACGSDPHCRASSTYTGLQCSSGYQGNLCGVCAAGHGMIKLFNCRACMNPATIIALYCLGGVVLLAFIKLLVHFSLQDNMGGPQQQGAVSPDQASRAKPAELIKPLVLYMQYMLTLASMGGFDWPNSISIPLRVLGWVWSSTSPETLTIDCLLASSGDADGGGVPLAVRMVLFYLSMPVVMLVLLVVLEALVLRQLAGSRTVFLARMKDRLLSSGMVCVFFFLPSVVRMVFSMFACVQIDQPAAAPYAAAAVGSYWVYDMTQVCFAGYHRPFALGLGLPLVLLVCLGLPLGIVMLMLRNRSRLDDPVFRQHYGFLCSSYKPAYCYWEAIVVWQTIVLVAISVFGVNLGPFYQGLVMTAALTAMVFLLTAVKPFAHDQAGIVMRQALQCLYLTSFVSLTFLPYSSIQPSPAYGVVMGVLLVLVNLAFVASVAWQLFKLVNWQQAKSTALQYARTISTAVALRWRQKPALGNTIKASGGASSSANAKDAAASA